jgi:nucleotide-binding universal stress UspA family protein
MVMAVLVWVTEATWPACVDAAARWAPEDAEFLLLHTEPGDASRAAHGAFAGLLGRGGPERDPGRRVDSLAKAAAEEILTAAARRLARPCATRLLAGAPERALVAAADGADLLVLARDGDLRYRGPHSLGPVGRFVVDHAPCPVLLVWPEPAVPPMAPPPRHPPGRRPPPP